MGVGSERCAGLCGAREAVRDLGWKAEEMGKEGKGRRGGERDEGDEWIGIHQIALSYVYFMDLIAR